MDLTLLLPWFPIVLAVGIGGRMLGKKRGLFLGIACALFWIVLVQATVGYSIWQDYWVVAAMVAGALAIIFMGSWAGESSSYVSGAHRIRGPVADVAPRTRGGAEPSEPHP